MGLAVAVVSAGFAASAAPVMAQDDVCNVGVSWNNFEQERWAAKDKPKAPCSVMIIPGGEVIFTQTGKLDPRTLRSQLVKVFQR